MPPRVKQQPVVRVARVQVPYRHAHGCANCARRFHDTCARPMEPRVCATCRLDHPVSQEERDYLPRECCFVNSRLVTDVQELSKYGLAGHTPWFRCQTCSRTHPFEPTKPIQQEQESP